jgi:hypothetical protein
MIPGGMIGCWEASWGVVQQDESVIRCWEGSGRVVGSRMVLEGVVGFTWTSHTRKIFLQWRYNLETCDDRRDCAIHVYGLVFAFGVLWEVG